MKVFVDTDVVISSLISPIGAAFLLLNQTDGLDLFISTISSLEIVEVAERLQLDRNALNKLIEKRFTVVKMKEQVEAIKEKHSGYVLDIDDAHIVEGAKEANVRFLITYNTKHFKAEKIKEDYNIIVATPANLLQYVRSL